MSELRLRLSGIGGQGIVFAGRLLAHALLDTGKHVALRYSYGAEVMGTPVHSEIVISSKPILCPYFRDADVAVVLHPRAFPEAFSQLSPTGFLILDSAINPARELPPTLRWEARPFVATSSKGRPGDPGRLAPVAALGFLAKLGFFPLEPLLRAASAGRAAQENLDALQLGFSL